MDVLLVGEMERTMNVKCHIKTELYKLSHSGLIWIHIFVPLGAVSVFLVYYRFAAWSELGKVTGYLQILSIAYPVIIALVTTIVSDFEMRAGHCQLVLMTPCHRSIVHIVKLSVLLVCGFLSCLLAVLGFGVAFRLMGNIRFSISFFVKSAVLLFCGNILLYEISYLVSFGFPKGAGIGLGIVGSLVAALMQTGLGDAVWYCVPCGISLRWCSLYALSQTEHANWIYDTDVRKSVVFMVISGVLLFVLLIFWGNTWEAKAAMEEWD